MNLSLILAAALAAPSAGPNANHYAEYVTPRGGQRGTTVEVVIHGSHMDKPRQVLFYRPGIECIDLQPLPTLKDGDERVRARFRIAADCPLGEHPLRLLVGEALSEVVTFWVGPFAVVQEKETKPGENDTPDRAQPVPMNVTVHGEMLGGEQVDRDCYRVTAKAGQRISVEVEAVRLGTLHHAGEVDTTVRVLGSDGSVLGRCDDSPLFVQDPHLTVVAPRDGEYVVEVSQPLYYAASHAYYRCHIGTFIRPKAVYPAGGKAGDTLAVQLIGDALGDAAQKVQLPTILGDFAYYAGANSDQPPSANTLRVSPYGNAMEERVSKTALAVPIALNGKIGEPGEEDRFRVRFEQGKTYRVRTFGRSLGNPIDPKIWVRPADAKDDKSELEADDSSRTEHDLPFCNPRWKDKRFLDPVALFRPKKSGDYLVGITDTRGKGGSDYVYRIEIEQAQDGVRTVLASPNPYHFQPLYRMDVPRGGRFTRNVTLAPIYGNGYRGDIELEAVGLPPGVTAIAPRFQSGATTMPVQFVAAANAPFRAAAFELRAKPVGKSPSPFVTGSFHGMAFTDRRNGLAWHFVFQDKLAIGVTDPSPFELELEQPSVALVQAGELQVTARIHRTAGYSGPVEVGLDWLPPGVEKEAPVVVPAGKDEIRLRIRASDKAQTGKHLIALTGMTGDDGNFLAPIGRSRCSSAFVELNVSEPYVVASIRRASVERGRRGQIVCDLAHAKELPGKAQAALLRLPNGVTMVQPAPTIRAGDKEVAFTVEVAPDALVGQYRDITCEVTVIENGQTIRQHTGSGTLRVDPAREPATKR